MHESTLWALGNEGPPDALAAHPARAAGESLRHSPMDLCGPHGRLLGITENATIRKQVH